MQCPSFIRAFFIQKYFSGKRNLPLLSGFQTKQKNYFEIQSMCKVLTFEIIKIALVYRLIFGIKIYLHFLISRIYSCFLDLIFLLIIDPKTVKFAEEMAMDSNARGSQSFQTYCISISLISKKEIWSNIDTSIKEERLESIENKRERERESKNSGTFYQHKELESWLFGENIGNLQNFKSKNRRSNLLACLVDIQFTHNTHSSFLKMGKFKFSSSFSTFYNQDQINDSKN